MPGIFSVGVFLSYVLYTLYGSNSTVLYVLHLSATSSTYVHTNSTVSTKLKNTVCRTWYCISRLPTGSSRSFRGFERSQLSISMLLEYTSMYCSLRTIYSSRW